MLDKRAFKWVRLTQALFSEGIVPAIHLERCQFTTQFDVKEKRKLR